MSATTKKNALTNDESCSGLFVDINDTIYCSQKNRNIVVKRSTKTSGNAWDIVVKYSLETIPIGPFGLITFQRKSLDSPHGLFVVNNFDLYVVDSGNNRIRVFEPGKQEGTTFLDDTVRISEKAIQYPTSIILDFDKNLYVADTGNHRIIFVSANKTVHRCLIGCTGTPGSSDDFLRNPVGISFDSDGNLFVADTGNHRVQKFFLKSPLSSE
jgi:DNA-binding beta-propeller fold protein YncE